MKSSDRLVGSPSRQRVEQFHEARLVRITHGGLAIWLDPFGMLNPQVVVKLLPELGVGVDLRRHANWLVETINLYDRLLSRCRSIGMGSVRGGILSWGL